MALRAGLAKLSIGTAVLTLALISTAGVAPIASATTTINQLSPMSGSVSVAGSAAFTAALTTDSGSGVTFTTSSASTGIEVSSSGVVSTTGTLTTTGSPYTASGTDTDGSGDTGTWNYSLTVTNTITQETPLTGTTDVAGSAAFTAALATDSGSGVTFTTSSASTGIEVSSSGVVSTAGTLTTTGSPYTASGTDTDGSGDTGTWNYSLTVTPDTIVQGSPTAGFVTTGNSANFTSTLAASSGFVGQVAFTTNTPNFSISNGDVLATTGILTVGSYAVAGTDTDADGDSGTWSYNLTVGQNGSVVPLVQTSPTTGTTTTAASMNFTAGPIAVQNSNGDVLFVTTQASAGLTVSDTGAISTTGTLAVGTYTVSGTDADPHGDVGAWTYTLTVTGVVSTVTFDANGGTGEMAPQNSSVPAPLTVNAFTWANHSFVDWNTSANGSGTSYANGASFPFSMSITLYAQWRAGKVPSHTITFSPNGGTGSMPREIENTPTAISSSKFVRPGFTFADWNTTPSGSGVAFKAGETYSFTKSLTLYAQWKAVPKPAALILFVANGGRGTMAPELEHGPSSLTANRFTRSGYTFVDWNTSASGSGTSYTNGGRYSFVASVVLYAQWKRNKTIAPPPAIPGGIAIGPFALNSSTLSSTLQAQIKGLAATIKKDGSTQISLMGYGDTLTAAKSKNQVAVTANIDLGRMRAQVVATYLETCLASIGEKGWSISIEAASVGTPSQSVVASLS